MKQQNFEDKVKYWIKQYKELVNSLNIGFALFDQEYVCWYSNDSLLEMIGEKKIFDTESGTVRRFNIRKVLLPSESEEVYDVIKKTEKELKKQSPVNSKKFYQAEGNLRHIQTGEIIPALVRSSIHLDENGEHDFTYVTITDLREQKRIQEELEHEKNKLAAIIFGIGDCVSVFDTKGNLILRNPQGLRIRGRQEEALMPLRQGSKETISLKIKGKTCYYNGKMEEVKDSREAIFAYVEILKDVTNEIKLKQKEQEFNRLKRKIMRLELQSEMVGASNAMRNIFDLIVRCSKVDSTILIQGETGVGKELVARAIYNRSPRRNKPFVAVNCGALPENLLESELFGHVKGAFTGAVSASKGLFPEAEGGTIFLDEVGDLNPSLQVKLLRVLQEKEIRPVGSSKSYPIDVRVITATNMDLKKMAGKNQYRHDLYYRLAVISIYVPPLRERRDDILPLAEYFIKKQIKKNKSIAKKLNHQSQKILLNYSWPGNIRELENCIEHVWAMTQSSIIKPENLPVQIVFPEEIISNDSGPKLSIKPEIKHEYSNNKPDKFSLKPWELEEKKTIEDALLRQKGNRTKTARDLGISRQTLWRKILQYHINY
ncbi:MAG: sigma-54 dependent transcriptional regulator [Desulfobacula sp.]|nr:sigma-54 dependent transcriptional regulator [Desulfobacula sp.]